MGMIMHDDVPYGEGTSYTQGTGIAINNNVIAVDADNTPTENSEKPVKSKGVYEEIEQIYADNGVLGAKNLLPNNAKTQTINGVTFTVNDDGSVTANGTATADATFVIFEGTTPPFNGFVLNGCPSSGGLSKYFIGYNQKSSPFITFGLDIGNGTIISIPSGHENDNYNIYIRIRNGITIENVTFYPMIRRASDPDNTYVPYAMTNRELTEDKLSISELKTIASSSADFAAFKTAIANL